MKNCVIRTLIDDLSCYWTGIGWLEDRTEAKRVSLPEAETLVDNMRGDNVMAYWERYDKARTAL